MVNTAEIIAIGKPLLEVLVVFISVCSTAMADSQEDASAIAMAATLRAPQNPKTPWSNSHSKRK